MADQTGRSLALIEANRRLTNLRRASSQQPVARRGLWPVLGCQPPATRSERLEETRCVSAGAREYPEKTVERPDSVPLHPTIALAMLRQGLAAPGRLWLLLRHLDQDGRGWLDKGTINHRLATNGKQAAPSDSLNICGRRQLRNLLHQGRGIFWDTDDERVWLRSAARVALALKAGKLIGRPVAMPLNVLTGGIGLVRAHLYATFHSSRRRAKPISRNALTQITQVPARTQRAYDRAAGVNRQVNIAVGQSITVEDHQESAWRHGRAVFEYLDATGQQGPVGRRYLAWRLPNSYEGPHQPCALGRKKKINRQIDLVTNGVQGNGLPPQDGFLFPPLLFHPDGRSAGRAYNRGCLTDIYWPQADRGKRNVPHTPIAIWHVFPVRRQVERDTSVMKGRK